MVQAFKKAISFTDVHWGGKSNSESHNQDCMNFLKWMTGLAHENGCETAIMLGDWHNNRNTLNVSTLNYSLNGMKYLAENFDQVYMIMGNHDIFFKDKRDLVSASFGQLLDKITIIQEPLVIGDTRFSPWLVGDEWKDVENWKERYIFGHFELPGFLLNAMVECPDHGTINRKHFQHNEYVFSGHFHKRQSQGNIHYIGNCFPHSYSDAWDFARGCMILEHGGKPVYVDWEDCPKYVTINLSELIEDPTRYLVKNTYARVSIDVDLSYEEMVAIREELEKMFPIRELEFRPKNLLDNGALEAIDLNFQSIDQIIVEGLMAVDSATIDNAYLVQIYQNL